MSTPARATIILAAGSAVALVAGALAAKVVALLAGPQGIGTVALLSSLLSLGAIIAGLGVGVGLVRQISAARARHEEAEVRPMRSAARAVALAASIVVGTAIILGRDSVASSLLGNSGAGDQVAIIAIAIIFNVMASVEAASVNGFHRVTILAAITAASSTLMAASVIAFVAGLGTNGVAPGLLLGSIAGWTTALIGSSALKIPGRTGPALSALGQNARILVRFGVPYTVSQLVGTGAQLMIPFIVLGLLGTSDVGHLRAASSISIAYLGFLLNAMSQDYYPRLAAITDPETLASTVRTQLRFVLAVSVPLILFTSAIAPIVIRILYAADFAPATDVLRWQLIGDLVKLPSWTIAFVILARGRSSTFLATETIGGVALIALTVVGVQLAGLVGAGIAYLATYLVYYPVVGFAARRELPPRYGRLEASIAALVAALIVIELSRPMLPEWAPTIVLLAMACASALVSWRMVLRPGERGSTTRGPGGNSV